MRCGQPTDRQPNGSSGRRATRFRRAADRPADECRNDDDDDDLGDIPPDTILPWSLEGIVRAQRDDPDIGVIIKLLEDNPEKPPWEAVASYSADTKAL